MLAVVVCVSAMAHIPILGMAVMYRASLWCVSRASTGLYTHGVGVEPLICPDFGNRGRASVVGQQQAIRGRRWSNLGKVLCTAAGFPCNCRGLTSAVGGGAILRWGEHDLNPTSEWVPAPHDHV